MRNAFIPTYYPLKNYADQDLSSVDKQWFGDMANIRVGPGRVRQVRMKKGTENGIICKCSVQISINTKYAMYYGSIYLIRSNKHQRGFIFFQSKSANNWLITNHCQL